MKRALLCIMLLVCAYGNVFAFLSQGHWRWRNNDGTEKTATWKAGQDTAITINDYKAIRLRIDIYNAQSSTKGYGTGLECATGVKGPWTSISSAASSSPFTLAGDNSFITDNDTTSAQLTEAGGYNFAHGRVITLSADHNDSLLVKQRKEYEWCIKPSAYVAPGTTYYFRASTQAGQTTNLPSLTTGNAFAGLPQILTNGSFEQGLTGWTNTDNNGGNTFAVSDTAFYDGSKGLRVTVNSAGASGSLSTAHTPISTDPARIYLVRFWAKADKNAAGMVLSLQGTHTNYQVSFKMYTKWQRYQYAFKTTDTSLAVKFVYQTKANYVLDDVTVVDNTDPVTDVNMTYMWQNNRPGYGWLTADGQESIKLPDGRIAWFFSDTWLGFNDITNNFTNTHQLVNNDLVIQNGAAPDGNLTTYFSGTQSSPTALMQPVTPVGAQSWYWPRDRVIENNNTLKILLPESDRPTPNAEPVYSYILSVATLSLPDMKVQKIENLPFTGDDQYSVILNEDKGDYNYVYGGRSDGGLGSYTIVARYPRNQLNAATPWEFLSASGWVKDHSQSIPIAQSTFGTIIKLDSANYAAVFEPNVSNSIEVLYATSPIGPWTNHTVLYHIPDLADGITYFAYLHKETENNGVFSISYSSNTSIQQMLNDKGTYQPHWILADIRGLSPYTVKKTTDTLLSFTARDSSQNVVLNWATAKKDDDHFDVERSADGLTWQVITTVQGNDTTTTAGTYATIDNSPINGLNYYRIKLFDLDNKVTTSAVKTIDITQSVELVSFTAKPNGNKVQLDWSTSSEKNNPGFDVQHSTDSTNFTTIATVPGNGTTTDAHTYQAFDDNPDDGVNYYRLQYYLNGSDTTSAIRTVDMTQKLAVKIYPNPTNAVIQFALTGYKGTTVSVTLNDISGKVIARESITTNYNNIPYTLKMKPGPGIYILKVNGEGLNKSNKVIVQ